MEFIYRAIFKNETLHFSIVPKPDPIIDELYCDSTDVSDTCVYIRILATVWICVPRYSGL